MSVASQRVLDYLEGQRGVVFAKLYQQPSTALAVFRRMLPHLAKSIVMAMLYMPGPFAAADLDAWFKSDNASQRVREHALSILVRLKILREDHAGPANARVWRLSTEYARSLRMALTGSGDHGSFGVPATPTSKQDITVEFLDTFARSQWEAILYFVVGSVNTGFDARVTIAAGTKDILAQGGFVVVKGGSGRNGQITQKGFEFLLEEINGQVWTLLLEYLRLIAETDLNEVEALSFLFTLGSLELGIPYDASNLTDTQTQMLDTLTNFGIIYCEDTSNPAYYYPTRLATTLTSDSPALPNSSITSTTVTTSSDTHTSSTHDPSPTAPKASTTSSTDVVEKGYIILETNYRVYAYTQSPLLIAILNLFATLKTRFPNMVSAKLTKTSTQNAIKLGITADQIVSYLSTHAHPVMRRQTPILPPTVVDQIRLWQLEGERMKASKGFLIRDVGGVDEYNAAAEHAETLGVLLWRDDARRWFFVSRFEMVQQYFKGVNQRRKDDAAAAAAAAAAGTAV